MGCGAYPGPHGPSGCEGSQQQYKLRLTQNREGRFDFHYLDRKPNQAPTPPQPRTHTKNGCLRGDPLVAPWSAPALGVSPWGAPAGPPLRARLPPAPLPVRPAPACPLNAPLLCAGRPPDLGCPRAGGRRPANGAWVAYAGPRAKLRAPSGSLRVPQQPARGSHVLKGVPWRAPKGPTRGPQGPLRGPMEPPWKALGRPLGNP